MWSYIYMFVCIYILFHGELDLFSLDSYHAVYIFAYNHIINQ